MLRAESIGDYPNLALKPLVCQAAYPSARKPALGQQAAMLAARLLRVFILLEFKRDGPDRKTHAGANLYRQPVRVVGEPYKKIRFLRIDYAVE